MEIVHSDVDGYEALLRGFHEDGFTYLADLCGVDYLLHEGRVLPEGIEPQRFEVVVVLRDMAEHRAVRVRCQVPEAEPTIWSVFPLWPGGEAMEREAYDLYGILFEGHPDLTRILLPDDWEGHPLRKDYAQGKVPVQFKAAKAFR
jgi:NADH-quinone oxidoreductase subunit C